MLRSVIIGSVHFGRFLFVLNIVGIIGGIFVHPVLVLCHSSALVAKLCSGNIAVLLKLPDSSFNAVNTVCGDNGKSCDSVVPIGRQAKNNGQKPL